MVKYMEKKENIKIPLVLIILLIIFLAIPYKGYINKRVYDSKSNYQVFRKINRSKIEIYDNFMVIYNKKNKQMDFLYYKTIKNAYIRNIDKIRYLEIYYHDKSVNQKGFISNAIILKNDEIKFWCDDIIDNIENKEKLNYLNNLDVKITEDEKKIKPFILKLQTPEEFYNNYKEYFFPYYLGDYEYKEND